MKDKDSISNVFRVVLGVSLVCSVLVAVAAISLRGKQNENRALDRKKNVLIAAGIYKKGLDIAQAFESIESIAVDLETGKTTKEIDPETYDMIKASKDPDTSMYLDSAVDIAQIRKIPHYAVIYLLKEEAEISKIILPINGLGLWSTLYGFISLEKDGKTVAGINFFEHSETPGLGGEVDNPNWQKNWIGKVAYNEAGDSILEVVKGAVDPSRPGSQYRVDGISGATITARAVGLMVQFWLGEHGYAKTIRELVGEEAK